MLLTARTQPECTLPGSCKAGVCTEKQIYAENKKGKNIIVMSSLRMCLSVKHK